MLSAIAVACALFAAGCGGDEGGSAADCPADGSTEARQTASPATDVTYLTGFTVERAGCGDRLVFEFRDEVPSAQVEYLPRDRALVEDGSGDPVEVDGDAFLVVRLSPAATAESKGDELVFTYTGPRRLRPDGTEFVEEALKTGDFEAVVTWAVGVSEQRPFRVTTAGRRVTVELS
jgi:hypothetical protein